MTTLADFRKRNLCFVEKGTRQAIELFEAPGETIKAYEIDISAKAPSYFKIVYKSLHPLPPSADGLYIGRSHNESFVIVVELEGTAAEFDGTHPERHTIQQVVQTIKHFCRCAQDSRLLDDGVRHHQSEPDDEYPVSREHKVLGVVIGAKVRKQAFAILQVCGKRYSIVCIQSRNPQLRYTLQRLYKTTRRIAGPAARGL